MLNIDKLTQQIDSCISSSISLFRLTGVDDKREYAIDLYDALEKKRISEDMIERVLHYMAFRMLKARHMPAVDAGTIFFQVDLGVVAFNMAQCEQYNAAHVFEPSQADSRLHLLIDTMVSTALSDMITKGKLNILRLKRNENDFEPQALRKYLVSRRIGFDGKGPVLDLEIDVTKIILTEEQRAAGLPALAKYHAANTKKANK